MKLCAINSSGDSAEVHICHWLGSAKPGEENS